MRDETEQHLSPTEMVNLLSMIEYDLHLKRLSNKELVAEMLESGAADYAIVNEMMTRLDPTWADETDEERRANNQ